MTKIEKYLVKFDAAGNRGETYPVDNTMTETRVNELVADGYTLIDADDYQYYVGNKGTGDNGTGYVRGSDGKPVSAPTRVATAEEKASAISATYEAQISELKDALATATLSDNTKLITDLKAEYATTMAAYQAALKGVE